MYKQNYNGPMLREMPEWDKPREKIFSSGASALSNAELIAVLLATGHQRESAISLGARVLSLGGESLSGLANLQPEEFMKIPGIGMAKACTLVAAIELGRRIAVTPREKKIDVSSPALVADVFMEDMRHLKKEVFVVAMLNIKNELIMKQKVSIGSLHAAASCPREVFADAIKKGASAIIIAHNHPSGDPTPSTADITTTVQLCEAGRILGIRVLDHIIIGDGAYISLNENGLVKFQ